MATIKALVSAGNPQVDLKKGGIYEVADDLAKKLVMDGTAEYVTTTGAETREDKTVKTTRKR